MTAAYIAYGAVMAILGAAVIWCAVMNRRYPGPPSRLGHALEADRLERMAAGHRDDPPHTVAWPPGTLHVPSGPQPCGCVVVSTPDGVQLITCPAHDPQFVSEWEARMEQ